MSLICVLMRGECQCALKADMNGYIVFLHSSALPTPSMLSSRKRIFIQSITYVDNDLKALGCELVAIIKQLPISVGLKLDIAERVREAEKQTFSQVYFVSFFIGPMTINLPIIVFLYSW